MRRAEVTWQCISLRTYVARICLESFSESCPVRTYALNGVGALMPLLISIHFGHHELDHLWERDIIVVP
jgi:hypothetical protein